MHISIFYQEFLSTNFLSDVIYGLKIMISGEISVFSSFSNLAPGSQVKKIRMRLQFS